MKATEMFEQLKEKHAEAKAQREQEERKALAVEAEAEAQRRARLTALPGEEALRQVAARFTAKGWTVVSMNEATLILGRKKEMSGFWALLGCLGLIFAVIPGLIAFAIGYASRGEEQLVFSVAQARKWLEKN